MRKTSIPDFMHNRNNKTKVSINLILVAMVMVCLIQTACHKNDDNLPGKPAPVEKPKPVIKNFSPEHGFYGDTILIEGGHFKDNDDVYFGGILATTILGSDSTHFKVLVPEGALSGSIQVRQGKDTSGTDAAFKVDHHIYISGIDYTFDYAAYWVDGQEFICNDFPHSSTAGIYANDKDVYVAGWQNNLVMCWKNQQPNKFTTDIRGQNDVKGMFVSGTDVYIAGNASLNDRVATYWKNGQEVMLTPREEGSTFGNGIFVFGTDVYVAGMKGNGQPLYWKNGIEIPLDGINMNPGATSIYVAGDDVHVAGNDFATARYWKNGAGVNLNDPDTCIATVSALLVVGDDVYITGHELSWMDGLMRAVYWKNGEIHFLSEGSEYADATGIRVVDGKLYISGMVDYYASAYWVDGELHRIPSLGHTSGIYVR